MESLKHDHSNKIAIGRVIVLTKSIPTGFQNIEDEIEITEMLTGKVNGFWIINRPGCQIRLYYLYNGDPLARVQVLNNDWLVDTTCKKLTTKTFEQSKNELK
jgi:hypothetical protein